MSSVKRFIVNPIEENTYVVWDDTKDCVIIDCGCFQNEEWNEIKKFIEEKNLNPVHLLNTHLHFDHVMGLHMAYRDFKLKPECSDKDMYLYENIGSQLQMFLGVNAENINMPPIGTFLDDGDEVKFGNTVLKVLSTPGHTRGGICFYDEANKKLFTGDTLFKESVGRTDFEGGNHRTLIEGIVEKILPLPDDVTIYPGHGGETSVGHEKKYNPYF